jgi:hypothetical protein
MPGISGLRTTGCCRVKCSWVGGVYCKEKGKKVLKFDANLFKKLGGGL